MTETFTFRAMESRDHDTLWTIIEPVIRAGESYALERDLDRAGAIDYWTGGTKQPFVLEIDGRFAGTYYLGPLQRGGGSHVGNCGYLVHPDFTGRGVAKALAADSIARASAQGFRALQFNFVVSTNVAAVAAWQRAGFNIVGTVPGAFEHPAHGFVDIHVMHRPLP